jgi:ribosomal protein S18 acetylase RimI-like enzyme
MNTRATIPKAAIPARPRADDTVPSGAAPSTVQTVALDEAERAVATIVVAFAADPAARWSFPEPATYLAHFPAVVRAFGGQAFANGSGHQVENYAGAALWLLPGAAPDQDEMIAIVETAVPADRRSDVFAVFEQMGGYHPQEPHWYLPLIGVDPARQNRGLGSALLRHALALCDKAGLPAYLESSNPANIPLYERHGFVRLGAIQIGSSPSIVPMLRKSRWADRG